MDNKNFQNLDPKLQEAYQKVMGTQLPQNQASQPPPQPVQQVPQASRPQAGLWQPPPPPSKPEINPNATQQPLVATKSETLKGVVAKKNSMTPILLLIGGIIFFAIYTYIWLRILEIPVPFIAS